MQNRREGRLSEYSAICGGSHCTRYAYHFQTKSRCVIRAARLSISSRRRLPLVDYKETEKGRCETCGYFAKHGGSEAPSPRFMRLNEPTAQTLILSTRITRPAMCTFRLSPHAFCIKLILSVRWPVCRAPAIGRPSWWNWFVSTGIVRTGGPTVPASVQWSITRNTACSA